MLDKFFKKESPLLNMIGFGGGAANRLTGFKVPPIEATGGTTNTDGGFKYHIYTVDTPAPTRNLAITFAPADATIELLVIGGGGGAGWNNGGGGGAGGIAYAPALPVDASTYPVSVGTGGTGTTNYDYSGSPQMKGNNSTFVHPGGTITGLGGAAPYAIDSLTEVKGAPAPLVAPGGSGAGTRRSGTRNPTYRPGIAAAQPTQPNFGLGVLHYGNNGGDVDQTQQYTGAGGGGAGGAGFDYNESVFQPSRGRGGAGQPFTGFPAPAVAPGIPSPNQPAFTPAVGPTGLYGGGGGGSSENKAPTGSSGGTGGGGGAGQAGKYGTGGGGGSSDTNGSNGGPGLVVLRYPV